MSFYNLLQHSNMFAPIIFEILDIDHTKIERYRDCGIDHANKIIWVYTRTGGNNAGHYPNEILTSNKNFINRIDDKFDNTYAIFYFSYPADPAKLKMIDEFVNYVKNNPEYVIKTKPVNWEQFFKDLEGQEKRTIG